MKPKKNTQMLVFFLDILQGEKLGSLGRVKKGLMD
jgi:hypothetical protein